MAPRPALAAVAFAVGVVGAAHGPLPGTATLWWSGALLLWLRWPRIPAARAAAWALAGAACLATSAANAPQPPPTVSADDRRADSVTGQVSGAIAVSSHAQRLLVDAGWGRVSVAVRGGRVPVALPGDRVQVRGRLRTPRGPRVPGGWDEEAWLAAAGADLAMSIDASELEVVAPGAAFTPWRWAAAAQLAAGRAIAARGGSERGRALVRAVVLGDRGGIDDGAAGSYRAAGVAHVLAVSGLHLAVVVMLALGAVRWSWAFAGGGAIVAPRRVAAVVAILCALGFTMITGARVSTLRALVVAVVLLAGVACDRRPRFVDALGLAAIAILAWRPAQLWDPGFQLSFAATAALALALGGERSQRRGSRLRSAIASGVRATLWATAATAPIAALWFHELAAAGVVGNLVIAPVVELAVLPLGLVGTLLAAALPAVGGPCLDLAIAVAGGVAAAAQHLGDAVPLRSMSPPGLAALALWYGALGAAMVAVRVAARRRLALISAGVLLVAAAAAHLWPAHIAPARSRDLRATFLDVGQGSAAIIEVPGGETWLVDAGGLPFVMPDADEPLVLGELPGRRAVVPALRALRRDRIDVAIVSHPHPDHYLGLRAVARHAAIGELWIARPAPETEWPRELRALVAWLRLRGTRVVHPPLGVARRVGGAALTVLGPRYLGDRAATDPVMSANDNSLVVRVDYAGRRILLPGDVELEAEEILAAGSARELAADVVAVPHHGSPSSSTAAFVAAISPAIAVVSCGRANRFEFPAPAVVARWRAAGAEVWRTDVRGSIVVTLTAAGALEVDSLL